MTVDGRLVVTFNELGLAAAVAGLGLVPMTVGAARKEVSEGLLVRVFADWDMGEVELHAGLPARKAAKPSACIRRLACFVIIFEMKLLQASESCSRSHNDLACFGRTNPRKDAGDL